MEDVDLRERARAKGVASRFAPGAVVDHPPRRERWGTAWADVHRAELLYAAIHAHPLPLGRALRATALMRARSVARAPFSADGVSAALSAVVEVAQMVVSWGSWQRDARTAARATP
jgi:hypothetical protein